jgi:hypothetical protein
MDRLLIGFVLTLASLLVISVSHATESTRSQHELRMAQGVSPLQHCLQMADSRMQSCVRARCVNPQSPNYGLCYNGCGLTRDEEKQTCRSLYRR